jgi:hypothetical protein
LSHMQGFQMARWRAEETTEFPSGQSQATTMGRVWG